MKILRLWHLLIFIALLFFTSQWVFAGNGAQNVLIVVNVNSQDSLQIGNMYRRTRGIPYAQVLPITTSTAFQVSAQVYLDEIEAPIRRYLNNPSLHDQITCIVLTPGVPQMVTVENGRSVASLLAAMESPSLKTTNRFAGIPNGYYDSPDAFSRRSPTCSGLYLVTSLLGYHTGDIMKLITQGVNADSTAPAGRFILQTTPQYQKQANTVARALAIRNITAEVTTSLPQDRHDLMGYFSAGIFSGLDQSLVKSCTFRPGAIADLAQNFSAAPANFDLSATPVLLPVSDFVSAGISGIHGLVGESPTNVIPVIANVGRLLGNYTNGFSLAESFYSASPVLNGQSIIIGDPLCAPYVQRPVITTEMMPNPIHGIAPVRITATSPQRGTTISGINVYIDGKYTQTVYEPGKTTIVLYIGEEQVVYTVPHASTLRNLLYDLANAINNDPILSGQDGVLAIPRLDANVLLLSARKAGAENNEIPLGLNIKTDEGSTTGVMGRIEGGWLSGGGQNPTPATGVISLLGRRVKAGDLLTVQIQQEHLSYTVPSDDVTTPAICRTLVELINKDSELKKTDGVLATMNADGMPYVQLTARSAGERSNSILYQIQVQNKEGSLLHAFPDTPTLLTDGHDGSASTQTIHFMLGDIIAKSRCLLDTTNLADGYHLLRLTATDGSLVQAQGVKDIPFMVQNQAFPPVVTLPNNLPPSSSKVTIPITVSDSVSQVNIFVDGQLLGTSSTAPFVTDISLATLGRGVHDLWAEGVDKDGHRYITPPIPLEVLTPPEITRITPDFTSQDGGTVHRIFGSGFQPDATVRLAEVPVKLVTFISPNLLQVISAAGPARRGKIEVTNPDGLTSALSNKFEYYKPQVARVNITPEHEVLVPGQQAQFTAQCLDQYNNVIQIALHWEATGGDISPTGLFTAGKDQGAYIVRALDPDGNNFWESRVTIGPAKIVDGRLVHWLVLGPFPDPDYTALEKSQLPDETVVQPSHNERVNDLTWQSIYGEENDYINLAQKLSPNINTVAYAHVYIYSAVEISCNLVYGSDDGIRIWLNRELKQSLLIRRGPDPNQNTTPIILQPGWNSLLVKVDQGVGGWGFYMRLQANANTVLPQLYYALDCPPKLLAHR